MQIIQIPISLEDPTQAKNIMQRFLDETTKEITKYNNSPVSESIALEEIQKFSNPIYVKDAHYSGGLSIEAAADNLMALIKLLEEPVKTFSPFTCVRALMESSALAIWLLDPTIDVDMRIKRCFAFRYKEFEEQIKYLRATNNKIDIESINEQIKTKSEEAKSLGYSEILDKNRKVIGIGQKMPTIIDLIGLTLKNESDYRLLSAMAHGHHWAMIDLGGNLSKISSPTGETIDVFEKGLSVEAVSYLISVAFPTFSKALWYRWQLYGWNLQEIKILLDLIADELAYSLELRFWHFLNFN